VELALLDRVINMTEEGVDVAVRISHLSDSSMIAIPVGEIRRVVCASPGLLGEIRRPEQPRDLADLNCALENYEAYMATVPSDDEASMWISDIRMRLGQ
jgi:DNA-binding transcriptional LysR family regulator